jgi:hypothetical protein
MADPIDGIKEIRRKANLSLSAKVNSFPFKNQSRSI